MPQKELTTVKELLFWSYANLAMAHSAVARNQDKYKPFNYMIRARLFKGLLNGTMNIRTLFDDEKIKLQSGKKCSYCGSDKHLAIDHIFPQKLGGKDSGDNLIYACKSCNSSKGKKDMMEWMLSKGNFPALMILRRYLKLIIQYCIDENLMEKHIEELKGQEYPFKLECIPITFPPPSELVLIK